MSLVIDGSREVGLADQGSAAVAAAAAAAAVLVANVPVYLRGGEKGAVGKGEEEGGGGGRDDEFCLGRRRRRRRVCEEAEGGGEEYSSESSSSIGIAGESSLSSSSSEAVDGRGGVDGEEEVQSKLRESDSLGSLASLEGSLPVKRGLSNFFNGKSKSFASLSEAVTAATLAADLAKPENPFNKRRRILMSAKASWRRRASCSSLSTAFSTSSLLRSPPDLLHSLAESEEEDESEEEKDNMALAPLLPLQRRSNLNAFTSSRSFSLCDLQQHA